MTAGNQPSSSGNTGPSSPGSAGAPSAWQYRESIGSDWGEWFCLNIPIEKFKEDEKHAFEDGLYEIRPLYAEPQPASAAQVSSSPVEISQETVGKIVHKLHGERDQAIRESLELEKEVVRLRKELAAAAQAEPERLPTHGNLLAEINKAAHAAGTNAWVRDVLKQAHRAIRLNAPLAAVTPSPAQPPRTPLDLSAGELNTLATDAFREAAQGSAVAWTGEYDGHLDATIYRDTMERWKALGRKITPLYAVTPSPGPGEWQPIETAPGRIREFAKLRQNTIPHGPVVQLGGSLEDGSLYLFGHHALTHEVQQWIVIPALYCRPMDALSVSSTKLGSPK